MSCSHSRRGRPVPPPAREPRAAAPAAATVMSWTSSRRTLRVTAATRSYLEVNENFNAGWQAVLAGRALQPVQLDGWKQAWVLPAGSAGLVTLTYQPESLYRDAVVGGLAALALVWPSRSACAAPRHRARRRAGRGRTAPPAPGQPPAAGRLGRAGGADAGPGWRAGRAPWRWPGWCSAAIRARSLCPPWPERSALLARTWRALRSRGCSAGCCRRRRGRRGRPAPGVRRGLRAARQRCCRTRSRRSSA